MDTLPTCCIVPWIIANPMMRCVNRRMRDIKLTTAERIRTRITPCAIDPTLFARHTPADYIPWITMADAAFHGQTRVLSDMFRGMRENELSDFDKHVLYFIVSRFAARMRTSFIERFGLPARSRSMRTRSQVYVCTLLTERRFREARYFVRAVCEQSDGFSHPSPQRCRN